MQAQHLLALDCANSFYSNLVIYGTSSKAIVVHDVAQGCRLCPITRTLTPNSHPEIHLIVGSSSRGRGL